MAQPSKTRGEMSQGSERREVKEKECKMYLVCDSCNYYPIQPMHGHYMCPSCKMPTKCCEGMALEA